jgi:hypothetical protein
VQADLFESRLTPGRRGRGRPATRPHVTCAACGLPFRRMRPQQIYCGRKCGSGVRRDRPVPPILREVTSCAHCQRSFDRPRGTTRRFCSGTCRGAHANTLRPMRITAFRCHKCGTLFSNGGRPRLFCSRECAGLDRNPRPFVYRSSRRYAELARRILERDHYRCGLCGKRINPRQRPPHPLSASLDHIVPRSAGGTDDPANLQAAHARCNRRRGHLGPAQFRMGGADGAVAQ